MSIDGQIRKSMGLVTVAVVVLRERARSYGVSRDGNPSRLHLQWLPKSQASIEKATMQPFVAMTMPAWLARQKRIFPYSEPKLSIAKEWSDEDRAAWDRAQSVAREIRIDMNKHSRQQAIGPLAGRNHYA